jgi:hypothetical protein
MMNNTNSWVKIYVHLSNNVVRTIRPIISRDFEVGFVVGS